MNGRVFLHTCFQKLKQHNSHRLRLRISSSAFKYTRKSIETAHYVRPKIYWVQPRPWEGKRETVADSEGGIRHRPNTVQFFWLNSVSFQQSKGHGVSEPALHQTITCKSHQRTLWVSFISSSTPFSLFAFWSCWKVCCDKIFWSNSQLCYLLKLLRKR